MIVDIKLRAGKYMVPAKIDVREEHIFLSWGFNRTLIAAVKMMEGAYWCGIDDPTRKSWWRVNNSPRNKFQLEYLMGGNPYEHYDKDIIKNEYERPLYQHQKDGADFLLARKRAILAAEMGCGKSLACIEVMERSGFDNWMYVGPRSAVKAVEIELVKWGSKVRPIMLTYEGVTKLINQWQENRIVPQGVWFDESSRIKNPTAQRSQAAAELSKRIKETYGDNGYVILTSGSPAPKSPLDWWFQTEITCPGFLKEGTYAKFRNSLAIIQKEENPFGQAYPKIVAWLDNSTKCSTCGLTKENHSLEDHAYTTSTNEVERLYKRMNGLVLVQFKKDCLDLPDKIYRQIKLEPTQKVLEIAKTLAKSARTVAQGLILLRELSDGFQYIEVQDGTTMCPTCKGDKVIPNPMKDADIPMDSMPADFSIEDTVICDNCGGTGDVPTYRRDIQLIDTPKDDALRDLLDEYTDVGRVVIYGGFTGSIDKIVGVCTDAHWNYIRVDGRGWHSDIDGDHLDIFQNKLSEHPRVAFIGQPGAAGMGLTLTASPVIIYYSNDHNGESRIQSEDRIHRPGMDANRGATIIDLLHLQTDYLVLENLQKKRRLQAITLGEITEALNGS